MSAPASSRERRPASRSNDSGCVTIQKAPASTPSKNSRAASSGAMPFSRSSVRQWSAAVPACGLSATSSKIRVRTCAGTNADTPTCGKACAHSRCSVSASCWAACFDVPYAPMPGVVPMPPTDVVTTTRDGRGSAPMRGTNERTQ